MWRLGLLFMIAFLLTASMCSKTAKRVDRCEFRLRSGHRRSLPSGPPVYGVQRIGNEIYVIRDSTPYIEVYDRFTFLPKRNITVRGMRGPYDMVKISQYPISLLIADWFNNGGIISVQIPQETVTEWSSVENSATTVLGLAGSNRYTEARAIATSSESRKLRKFGGAGNLVEEISIRNISSPRHTIQVDSNRYAVCHGYGRAPEQHRVCLVDGDGRIEKCRGGRRGSGSGRFNVPARLEPFGGARCMLVADAGNRRVVVLGTDHLDYLGTPISSGLDGPYRLHFDAEDKTLYVADNKVAADGIAVSGRVRLYSFK